MSQHPRAAAGSESTVPSPPSGAAAGPGGEAAGEARLPPELQQALSSHPFLHPSLSATLSPLDYTQALLSTGRPLPQMIGVLQDGAQLVEGALASLLTQHLQLLLAPLHALPEVESQLRRVTGSVLALQEASRGLQSQLGPPIEQLRSACVRHRNLLRAVSALRSVSRVVSLHAKLEELLAQSDVRNIPRGATIWAELQDALSDESLRGLNWRLETESKVLSQGRLLREAARRYLKEALQSRSQMQLALALQALYHLSALKEELNAILEHLVETVQGQLRKVSSLALSLTGEGSSAPPPSSSSSAAAAAASSRARLEWRQAMEKVVMGEITAGCTTVLLVEAVLLRCRDSSTTQRQPLLWGVTGSREQGIFSHHWARMGGLLVKEVGSSIRPSDYPFFLSLLLEMRRRVRDHIKATTAQGEARDFSFIDWDGSGERDTLLSPIRDRLERWYLEAAGRRLSTLLGRRDAVDADAVRLVLREEMEATSLDVLRASLEGLVEREVLRWVRDHQEGDSSADDARVANSCAQLSRAVAPFLLPTSPVLPALRSLHDRSMEDLWRPARNRLASILGSMHGRGEGAPAATPQGRTGSPHMVEFSAAVQQLHSDLVPRLLPTPWRRLYLQELVSSVVAAFLRQCATLLPLDETAIAHLTVDVTSFQVGLSPLAEAGGSGKQWEHQLATFKKLLYEDPHLSSPASLNPVFLATLGTEVVMLVLWSRHFPHCPPHPAISCRAGDVPVDNPKGRPSWVYRWWSPREPLREPSPTLAAVRLKGYLGCLQEHRTQVDSKGETHYGKSYVVLKEFLDLWSQEVKQKVDGQSGKGGK